MQSNQENSINNKSPAVQANIEQNSGNSLKRVALRLLTNSLVMMAGALLIFAFAPTYKGMLALIWPAILLVICRHDSAWKAFRRGWLFGLGFFLAAVYWLWFSMHIYYQVPGLLSMGAVFLFGMYLALFPALTISLSVRIGVYKNPFVMITVFPVLWTLFEMFRGWFLTGFPWVAIGYSQTDTLLASMAPVLGVYGTGWLVVLVAATVAALYSNKKPVWLAGVAIFTVCSLIGWSLVCWILLALFAAYALYQKQWVVLPAIIVVLLCLPLSLIQWSEPQGKILKVSLVQGNISPHVKWEIPSISRKTYNDLSAPLWKLNKKDGEFNPDLVVWPETAMPYLGEENFKFIVDSLKASVNKHGSEVITGLVHRTNKKVNGKESYVDYNSVIKVGKDVQRYNKYHLVPYGEYIPLKGMLGWLYDKVGLEMPEFNRGEMPQNLLTVRGLPVAVSICYEAAFPHEIIQGLPKSSFLINLSNNAWFYNPVRFNAWYYSPLRLVENAHTITNNLMKKFPATGVKASYKQWFNDSTEAYQVLQIGQMRALETSRYILSVTNDGVTAIIDHKGRIVKALPRFRSGVLNGEVQPMQGATLFVLTGHYLSLGLMLLSLLIGIFIARRVN